VAGIVAPETGRIAVNEVEVTALGDAARRHFRIERMGLVFQEFALLEHLSVMDNVLLPYRISPALELDTEARQRAKELLVQVGLADRAARLVTKLSQGERQRVAVCRALLPKPALVLADEPTGNLDSKSSKAVVDLLMELNRTGLTLVVITHDLDVAEQFPRRLDLRDGEIVRDRSAA